MDLEDWILKCKENLENIKKFEPQDRIDKTMQLLYMQKSLAESLNGWGIWINFWLNTVLLKKIKVSLPKTILMLKDPELEKTFEKFKVITQDFLELDLEITKLMENRKGKKIDVEKLIPVIPEDKSGMII